MTAFINWLKKLLGIGIPAPMPTLPVPNTPSGPPPIVATGPAPSAPGEDHGKIYGPDLSHWEPGANWKDVASDNGFGITKATEGTGNTDPLFAAYRKDMVANLEVCGFYHFFHPSQDPIAQAKHFLAVVGPIRLYDFLALDWEVSDGISPAAQQSAAKKFLDYVYEQTGKVPWIYADKGSFVDKIQDGYFQKYNIWMAQLSSKLTPPAQFSRVDLWQYTFTGKYKGVPHPCDGNVFNGNLADLKKLIVRKFA